MNPGFAERLRDGTRGLHADAERSGMMAELLCGRLDARGYSGLLRNLLALYEALEASLERHRSEACVSRIRFPALFRAPALRDDLQALHGASWREEIPLEQSGARYAGRLCELAEGEPRLLVAHAYVRYLGDLNGGQVLKRIVAASLRIPAGAGTRFYEFGSQADVVAACAAFRRGLDDLPADAQDAILAESRLAFAMHVSLFEELHSRYCPAAAGEPAIPAST